MGAAFSPDGRELATASTDGAASVWSMRGDLKHRHGAYAGEVNAVSFDPSGRLVTAGADGLIVVWDDRTLFADIPARVRPPLEGVHAPDDHTLFSRRPSGSVTMVEAEPSDWRAHACSLAGRALTPTEWGAAFGDLAYAPACTG